MSDYNRYNQINQQDSGRGGNTGRGGYNIRGNNQRYMTNIANYMNKMQPSVTSVEGSTDKILLFSQPSTQPFYPNAPQCQSILGAPLIPILANSNDKHVTATEKNLQIIEEVMKQKERDSSLNTSSIYQKSSQKCDLHPKTLSDKCRKCKEIKAKIDTEISLKIESHHMYQVQTTEMPYNSYQMSQNLSQIDEDKSSINLALMQDPLFTIYGDPLTCNLNSLILNNILSCQYFKEDCAMKGFNEIIDEIIQNVTYAEPWAVGISGVPSTLFCCLYKLMLLKLTEGQVNYLINCIESPYVRCVGFLYIRYLSDPRDLWNRLSPFLDDDKMFFPKADRKTQIQMGEYIKNLLIEYDYYGTRLPRIPTPIERDIKARFLLFKQEEKPWEVVDHHSTRENYRDREENYPKKVSKKDSSSRSRSKSKKNKKSKKHKNKKDRKRKSRSRTYSSSREYSSRSRSNSRERRKKKHNRKRDRSKSKSRSISRYKSSRSRSRSKSYKYKKNERNFIDKIKEQERDAAVAKGKEYSHKPSSYKTSLSLKLPGNFSRRSISPSPIKRNVEIIERKTDLSLQELDKKPKKIEYSKEFLERQEQLKKQYGSSSNITSSSASVNKTKSSESHETEFMRLG